MQPSLVQKRCHYPLADHLHAAHLGELSIFSCFTFPTATARVVRRMPCAAGELCMIPNLTPEPPDGHRCRGGCGGRLHGVCGQVVEEDADSDNPLRRICPTCSTAGDDVSRASTKGKRKAGAKKRGRGPGQHHPQPNDGIKSRTQLTLGQKLEMLELLTHKMSHAELARRYKCSARTVSNVAQKREQLEAEASPSSSSQPPPAPAAARRASGDRDRDHGACPTPAVRRKRSAASTTARETQAISSAAGMPCAARELCMVPSLTPGPPYGQPCPGGCGGQLHDVCGEVVEVELQEEQDQSDSDKNSSSSYRVCPTCATTANIPAAAGAAAAAAATAVAATAAAAAAAHDDGDVSRTSAGSKRKASEDARGSGSGEYHHHHQSKLHKPSADTTSKSRTQLTLGQKLEMLKLLTQKVSHRELARRYKCAARTVSNVAQNRAALEAEGTSLSGGRIGSSTRKRSAAFPEVSACARLVGIVPGIGWQVLIVVRVCVLHIKPFFVLVDIQHTAHPVSVTLLPTSRDPKNMIPGTWYIICCTLYQYLPINSLYQVRGTYML